MVVCCCCLRAHVHIAYSNHVSSSCHVKSGPQEEKTTPTPALPWPYTLIGASCRAVRSSDRPIPRRRRPFRNRQTHTQRYEERMRDADNNKQTNNPVTARSVMCFRSNSFDYFHLSSRKIRRLFRRKLSSLFFTLASQHLFGQFLFFFLSFFSPSVSSFLNSPL